VVSESAEALQFREPGVSYSYDFGVKNGTLSLENSYFWDF
jgi:hypothetical protein